MTEETRTLTMNDTAVLLRVRLGPLRAWYPFLTDNIRGQQDIHGFRLLPCGKRRGECSRGKSFQPVYSLSDITQFIENVLLAVPEAGKVPIKPVTLMVDRSRSWRMNRFDVDGMPITTHEKIH